METDKLGLPKITGNMTADVVRDVNALADAIDGKVGTSNGLATLGSDGKVPASQLNVDTSDLATKTELQGLDDEVTTHLAEKASLTEAGHVQLSNSTTSTSEDLAATPSAVKVAMDKANEAFQSANDGKIAVASAITDKGVAASPTDTFPTLASKIGQIVTGKKWASGVATLGPLGAFYINHCDITVNGLDFLPSLIYVMSYSNDSYRVTYGTIYDPYVPIENPNNDPVFMFAIGSTLQRNLPLGSPYGMYVNETGFRLLVSTSGDSRYTTAKWIAFE